MSPLLWLVYVNLCKITRQLHKNTEQSVADIRFTGSVGHARLLFRNDLFSIQVIPQLSLDIVQSCPPGSAGRPVPVTETKEFIIPGRVLVT